MRIATRRRFAARIAGHAARSIASAMLVSIAACSAAAPAGIAKETPAPTSGKPAGKISPEMAGKFSPIAAFKGRGDGWLIEIHALDATQHHVALLWSATDERATGIAGYDGPLGVARDAAPLILNGTLERGGTKRALRIEIRTEPCTDIDGIPRPQRIAIDIDPKTTLRGCGDLAVY